MYIDNIDYTDKTDNTVHTDNTDNAENTDNTDNTDNRDNTNSESVCVRRRCFMLDYAFDHKDTFVEHVENDIEYRRQSEHKRFLFDVTKN